MPDPVLNPLKRSRTQLAPTQRKRQKGNDGANPRHIATQKASVILQNGEINVATYVSAREFEIKALEKGMKNAKKGLASRAHQGLPRDLRRRAASHNVKRLPKRLQERARREMKADGAVTVKPPGQRKPDRAKAWLRRDTVKRLIGLAKGSSKSSTTTIPMTGDGEMNDKESETVVDVSRKSKAKESKPMRNNLVPPALQKGKFRKRQIHKTWLPTHLYHAKRARMTEPKNPLWRFALPLTNTEKSYRSTHRASTIRGAVAWDTSYISTIGMEGTDKTLERVLMLLNFGKAPGRTCWDEEGTKWRRGARTWQSWVWSKVGEPIAPVTVIWCAIEQDYQPEVGQNGKDLINLRKDRSEHRQKKASKRKLMIRVHPSAFLQLWNELLPITKAQTPQVMVEDLRFEIGTIEITGPGAFEALVGILHPSTTVDTQVPSPGQRPGDLSRPDKNSHSEIFQSLRGISTPSALPNHTLLGFTVCDPRLRYPPKTYNSSQRTSDTRLLEILTCWPADKTGPSPFIFSRKARLLSSHMLPSQKAISRRKRGAPPGEYPSPLPNDPEIPMLMYITQPSPTVNVQSTISVLLPWKAIQRTWYCLMHYPLSTGGTIRFGGLDEYRQLSFEQEKPWFPGDFPGTLSGRTWEGLERVRRKTEWDRMPRARKVNFDELELCTKDNKKGELGIGWGCDWERLLSGPPKPEPTTDAMTGEEVSDLPATMDLDNPATSSDKYQNDQRQNAMAEISEGRTPENVKMNHIPSHLASVILQHPSRFSMNISSILDPNQTPSYPKISYNVGNSLISVSITLLTRGVPQPCSRMYRLPVTDAALRKRWTEILNSSLPWLAQGAANELGGDNYEDLAEEKGVEAETDIDGHLIDTSQPTPLPRSKGRKNMKPHLAIAADGQIVLSGGGSFSPTPTRPVKESVGSAKTTAAARKVHKEIRKSFHAMRADPNDSPAQRRAKLAALLIAGSMVRAELKDPERLKPSDKEYPPVPCEEDLIGFVTNGAFNLSLGKGSGIGSLLLDRVCCSGIGRGRMARIIIVRAPGDKVGRLALWELA